MGLEWRGRTNFKLGEEDGGGGGEGEACNYSIPVLGGASG